jgi:hypothetical protein
MSYDYWLMRARNPIRGSADVDEPNVAPIGTLQEIKPLVQKTRPNFEWNEKERYCWFKDESANVRLHIGFGEPGPQFLVITVKAWWRERFHEQLVALATSLGLFAFDPQQGRLVGGVVEPPS